MTLRVLLADADEPTLVGMRVALETSGLHVLAAVTTADDAVLAAQGTRPDIALLAAEMPGGGGIAAAARIARDVPSTAVVVIGDVPTDEQLFGALRAGALGYLLRRTDPDRLAHALRGVASGEAPIPRSLVTRLIAEFRRGDRGRIPMTGPGGERLSARESDVLALLAQGASTRAAAVALGVSEVTVRRHVSGAVAKLGVPDRAAALAALRAAGGA
ncbi:MAG: response regulator transcription factor [Solirubrobacteraceae bacterium]